MDFVVVGGIAATLLGAPITTYDLEVVHSTATENVDRLLCALADLNAVYRLQPERRLQPGASLLASTCHQLLMTKYGPADVLGAIGRGRQYANLLPVGEGRLPPLQTRQYPLHHSQVRLIRSPAGC